MHGYYDYGGYTMVAARLLTYFFVLLFFPLSFGDCMEIAVGYYSIPRWLLC